MKRCSGCTQLEDGACAKYRKPPPNDEFAAKCRYFEQGEAAIVEPERTCADCERYDWDELSEWCLFHSAADCITFKPLPLSKGESCPLT